MIFDGSLPYGELMLYVDIPFPFEILEYGKITKVHIIYDRDGLKEPWKLYSVFIFTESGSMIRVRSLMGRETKLIQEMQEAREKYKAGE